jgi:HPt (histidine-containing phosphotransfer) domain-containing protein
MAVWRTAEAAAVICAIAGVVAGAAGASAQQASAVAADPGKDKVLHICGGCHSIEQVFAQRRSHDEWQETVNRMRVNGAPVEDQDFDLIVEYLAKNYGTGE